MMVSGRPARDPGETMNIAHHLAGIDPHTTLPDKLNRPVPLAHDGAIVPEMLA